MAQTLTTILLQRARDLQAAPGRMPEFNTGSPESEALLCDLERSPHAFVIACIMDRQMKAERAWLIPHLIRERLGTFELGALRAVTPKQWSRVFRTPANLHRFPEDMARHTHSAVERIAACDGGNAARIWNDRPSSATLVLRFLEFDGAGPKIATMAANILVRDFHIPVADRYSIDISPDVQVKRVFSRLGLIQPDATNEQLIYAARSLNPEYPGVLDYAAWDIGRRWCGAQKRLCGDCCMRSVCPTASAAQ